MPEKNSNIMSPPKKSGKGGRKSRLPQPPVEGKTESHNLSKKAGDKQVQLHFISTASEKKEVKSIGVELGMSMTEIWREAFKDFKAKHGYASDR